MRKICLFCGLALLSMFLARPVESEAACGGGAGRGLFRGGCGAGVVARMQARRAARMGNVSVTTTRTFSRSATTCPTCPPAKTMPKVK